MVNPSRPTFQDKFNPTKKELKTLRHFETPLNKPKPAVSHRLGIVFTKAVTPCLAKRPPDDDNRFLLLKFRPWLVQYDTRIIPHHRLTTRQLARHKRLGIYHSDSWSNFPEDKIKIAVNTSRGASTAIAGFIAGLRETSNPNFCLLHKHHHSPLYHSEHRSRTKPSPRSIYFDKNTPLPADIDYPNQSKAENQILSLPTWFSPSS